VSYHINSYVAWMTEDAVCVVPHQVVVRDVGDGGRCGRTDGADVASR